jgi:Cupin-like domain
MARFQFDLRVLLAIIIIGFFTSEFQHIEVIKRDFTPSNIASLDKQAMQEGFYDGCDQLEDDWQGDVVKLLDMALILNNPGDHRDGLIEDIVTALEDAFDHGDSAHDSSKFIQDVYNVEPRDGPLEIRHPIKRVSDFSLNDMEEHYVMGAEPIPIVITEALKHWPAMVGSRSWKSPSYLLSKSFGGRRLVPVEIGLSYVDAEWSQIIIPFKKFTDDFLLNPSNPKKAGYLAQHDLFNQIPSLRSDIAIPDYCYTDPPVPMAGTAEAKKPPKPKLDTPLVNAWFGPAGTISPLHTDPYHNILCQVVGRKYVRIYSPLETLKLYPRGMEDNVDMSNTSQISIEHEESIDSRFPDFKNAKYLETVLNEGECLYIPIGCWHYVRSLSISFSVSFWWN